MKIEMDGKTIIEVDESIINFYVSKGMTRENAKMEALSAIIAHKGEYKTEQLTTEAKPTLLEG